MPVLDIVELGEATTTCRDRLRQLLSHVDEAGAIDETSLVSLIESTSCPQGHELHVRVLERGMLERTGGTSLRLGRAGQEWLIEYGRPAVSWGEDAPASAPELRDWQVAALDAWAAHGRSGVVEAVTGTGKSRVGVEAIREALADDYDVLVVVPTVALVDQWERTLKNSGISSIGAIRSGVRPTWSRHRVIIGAVQSLYSTPPRRADGKVLIVADECHRYGAPEWMRALHGSYRRRLGLTATFERNDEGIDTLIDYFGGGPIYRIGFPEAINADVVARYDVKLMGVDLTPEERVAYDDAEQRANDARTQLLAADFPAQPFGAFMTEVQKAAESDPDPTIQDVARRFLKAFSERVDVMAGAVHKLDAMQVLAPAVGSSRGALVFTRRKEAAEDLSLILKDEGVAAYPIHSGHSHAQRSERLAGLKTGRVQALVAPTVLDEGVDVPDVDLGIVMSGSKSRRQMIQRMGRVLRRKADGRKATFVVVYARDTAEDLSDCDGQEGALDLIVESADNVSYLHMDGQLLVEQPAQSSGDAVAYAVEAVQGGSPRAVRQVDAGTPEQRASELPQTLRRVDPRALAMTRKARDEYAMAHGVGESEASASLRVVLQEMLDHGRVYPRSVPYNSFALRGDGAELVITPDRFVGYRAYRRAAPPEKSATPVATSVDVDPIPELSGDEVDVLDHLVPATIQIGGEALEQVCDVFELGDLRLSDALQEARSLLTQDLGTGPEVGRVEGGYAVTCLLATWFIDEAVTQVLGVEARSGPDVGDLVWTSVAEERYLEPEPPESPSTSVQSERGPRDLGDQDTSRARGSVSPVRDSTESWVHQLERLAMMHREGLLTASEFSAAKAKLIF